MLPRWLIRAVFLSAVVAMLGLAGELIWFDGWRIWSPWVLVVMAASVLVSLFWTNPSSNARALFAKASFAVGVAVLLAVTAAVLGPQGGAVDETTWVLLGSLWCILLGALLVRFATAWAARGQ